MILSFPASNTVCGINRNIVECKVTVPFASGDARSVLIETLWNVKSYDATDKDITAFRINRNIVECKECAVKARLLFLHVLIETLWNVK